MREMLLLVVGDKFATFAAGRSVLTVSQLRGLLAIPSRFVLAGETYALVPGQGLTDEDVADIAARALSSPVGKHFDLTCWRALGDRAPASLSHKHAPHNTLISSPRRVDGGYELDLLVAENCELMGDHQTGLHLQGMLVVEAARQAALAVTEAHLLPPGEEPYFVFDSMAVDYRRFLFPVQASLRCRVTTHEKQTSGWRFGLEVTVIQAGKEVAEIAFAYTVVKRKSMSRVEAALARDALQVQFDAVLAEAAQQLSDAMAS